MDIYVRNATGFQRVKEVHVNDGSGSTPRKIKKVYVHDGSAWRQVYQEFVLQSNVNYGGQCTGYYDSEFGQDERQAYIEVNLFSDGSSYTVGEAQDYYYSWTSGRYFSGWRYWGLPLSSGVGAGFHARLRTVSGDAPNADLAANTWYQINGILSWEWIRSTYNGAYGTFYIDISADGGSTYTSSALSTASIVWEDAAA